MQVKEWKHQVQVQSKNSELYSETQRTRKQLKNRKERHDQLENTEPSELDSYPLRKSYPNDMTQLQCYEEYTFKSQTENYIVFWHVFV